MQGLILGDLVSSRAKIKIEFAVKNKIVTELTSKLALLQEIAYFKTYD